ncbi:MULTISPECIES: type I methionyl aminopeptidase [Halomonadaceae]|uniref:Methionine aminopeptidase n=2 Tax=Halomonadaceae TaxID=28256 RepID=A0A8H9ILZ3_9GAMM|nr:MULTISPECIES: type I methionyl aminopeptidase [Halomonas]ATH77622.1 type I methionyl aminopeptidase [Halomonas hydrothermalis]KHJ52861.1 methionine aminopeptidase [Halomonas hydrothermalis]UDM06785.1 type I methionyl aminopeptidase [Halomonas sp. NyZ770]GGW62750.1 methionine aminopeptidase [Halomonas johnsoniae]GHD54895.1 methionine aminopeptidase [Halomonas hamiltonii]
MNVPIKTPSEIEKMREAGRQAASVIEMITPHIQAGISTGEIDRLCHEYIVNELGSVPAPLNYHGFPKATCTSINHVVCHGIPDDAKKLKSGDIMNLDITVRTPDGYHGDSSVMFVIGETIQGERLCRITQECLYKSIALVKPGVRLSELARVIQQHAEAHGYSVVRDFCGHGIGADFHEDPQFLHYDGYAPDADIRLDAGMCFTIEPMINVGGYKTKVLRDGWTAVTKDRSLSAQWEHTLLVTETGVEVLTARSDEDFGFLNA